MFKLRCNYFHHSIFVSKETSVVKGVFLNINTSLYFVFIFSGVFKLILPFFHINLPDVTILSFVFLISCLILSNILVDRQHFSMERYDVLLIAMLMIFFSFYLLSALYSYSSVYIQKKLTGTVLNIISFVFPLLFSLKKELFFKLVIILSSFIGVLNVYAKVELEYSYVKESLPALYLTAGMLLGYTIFLIPGVTQGIKTFCLQFFVFLLLILSTSRGPLLIAVFVFFIFVIYNLITRKKIKKKSSFFKNTILLFCFLIVLLSVFMVYSEKLSDVFDKTEQRLSLIFSDDKGQSINDRINKIDTALNMIESMPILGGGMASFPIYAGGIDVRIFPHNIFLELYCESGVVPLILFFIFISMVLVKLFKEKNSIGIAVFLYGMLNAMKSSGFEDLRVFFAIIAVSLVISNERKNDGI